MNVVRVCVSLKKSNLKLLDGSKGIATRSAFLDYLIENALGEKQSSGGKYSGINTRLEIAHL